MLLKNKHQKLKKKLVKEYVCLHCVRLFLSTENEMKWTQHYAYLTSEFYFCYYMYFSVVWQFIVYEIINGASTNNFHIFVQSTGSK